MSEDDVRRSLADAGEAEPAPPDDLELAQLPWNDLGNGHRLRRRHGHDLSYVERVGMHVWDGMRWNADGGDFEAQKRAHLTVEKLVDEAKVLARPAKEALDIAKAAYSAVKAGKPRRGAPREQQAAYLIDEMAAVRTLEVAQEDYDLAAKMFTFATASGNSGKIGGLVEQAKPYLRRHPREMDVSPLRLTVRNGTIELLPATFDGVGAAAMVKDPPRVVLRQFRREDLITKLAGVAYDKNADAPLWRAVVARALPDPTVRAFVQRFFGYCLTGDISEQVMAVFYGTGKNAKTTIIETVSEVLGEIAVTVPFATFVADDRKRSGEHTPELVRMVGARLVTATEPEVGDRLSEGTIKTATGGERIVAREMYEKQFEYSPAFKVLLACNFKPSIRGQDDGIWRRILLVPFVVKIPEEERDRHLRDKLRAELPGILNWLVDGYLRWAEIGLAVPEVVRNATDEYRRESDPVGEFLRNCTREHDGGSVQASAMYRVYVAWCRESAIDPKSQTMFGKMLSDRGIQRQKVGVQFYRHRVFTEAGQELLSRLNKSGSPADSAADAADGGPTPDHDERFDDREPLE